MGDEIKKNGIGGHVARMGEKRSSYRGGSLWERGYLEHLGLDGKIIFKWFSKKWNGGLDWIDMALDRDR
jgi:hypothetical protein